MTFRAPPNELIWLPVVLAGLLLIFLPGLGNLPVFDDAYLTNGQLFSDFQTPAFRARLLSYGSFVWVHALLGDGLWKQRLVNLAVHFSVVLSLWAFYREVLRHIALPPAEAAAPGGVVPYYRAPALGVAIGFFALNPAAVYAVSYLIQRSILLATLFVVLALWLFMRALSTRRILLYLLSLACYALALMCKEHAILAPFAAIPLYIIVARPTPRRLGALSAAGLLLVGCAAAILYRRYGAILGKPFDEYSHVYLAQLSRLDPGAARNAYPLSIVNESYLFFQYGLRWFIPYAGWMSIDLRPPFPLTLTTFPQVLGIAGYPAIVVGGFLAVIRYRDGRAHLGLSVLLPAILFATEFATVWVQDPFVLYRSYLWAIGVPGLTFFALHGPSGRVLLGAGLVAGALLAWQALDRVLSMATPQSAWTDAIAKLPNDPRAVGRWFPYLNRGSDYVDHNDFDAAMRDFQASASLGDLGMGDMNQGSLLSAAGKQEMALAAFDRAERQGYDLYNLPLQKGLALAAIGRAAKAHEQFQVALQMSPPSPSKEIALLNLGRTALQIGQQDEAARDLERLLVLQPANREARYVLAMACIAKGDLSRAHELLDRLLLEAPSAPYFYARAIANFRLARKADALADIDNAVRLAPSNPNLREWQQKIQAMP